MARLALHRSIMLTIGLQGDDDDGDNGYVLDYGAQ